MCYEQICAYICNICYFKPHWIKLKTRVRLQEMGKNSETIIICCENHLNNPIISTVSKMNLYQRYNHLWNTWPICIIVFVYIRVHMVALVLYLHPRKNTIKKRVIWNKRVWRTYIRKVLVCDVIMNVWKETHISGK